MWLSHSSTSTPGCRRVEPPGGTGQCRLVANGSFSLFFLCLFVALPFGHDAPWRGVAGARGGGGGGGGGWSLSQRRSKWFEFGWA